MMPPPLAVIRRTRLCFSATVSLGQDPSCASSDLFPIDLFCLQLQPVQNSVDSM